MEKTPIKSALFIDFDNMFIGLQQSIDDTVAESFASKPLQWLNWIIKGMPDIIGDGGSPRKVLVRNCYLNPQSFSKYRIHFVQAGFRVIDCPPMSAFGSKTSADIYMAIDILDINSQLPHIEEFFLLSSDKDFTPILQRLRSHDKKTVVIGAGPVSHGYQSACDLIITGENFSDIAIETITSSRQYGNANRDKNINFSESALKKLEKGIITCIDQLLAQSDKAILMSTVAHQIIKEVGKDVTLTNWVNTGSFRKFLASHQGNNKFQMHIIEKDAYLYDPDRHPIPSHQQPLGDISEEMREFITEIHNTIGTPLFGPEKYSEIFKAISNYEVHNEDEFNLTQATKDIRDILANYQIPRSVVNYVFSGLLRQGYRFNSGHTDTTTSELAEIFKDSLVASLEYNGLEVDEYKMGMFSEWLCGKVEFIPLQ